MHCVVSWDITESAGYPSRSVIDAMMVAAFQPYPKVHVLSTFYVVGLPGQPDYNWLQTRLTSIAQQYHGRVNFVMTPLMSGGAYTGYLPQNLWNELNRLST